MESDKFETGVKEFGNGAHITVPKEWCGKLVSVEIIGEYHPPLFTDIREGVDVSFDVNTNQDELASSKGLNEEVANVSGEVLEYRLEEVDGQKGLQGTVMIDSGSQFYRIQIKRNVGEEGWQESQYKVYRDMSDGEIHETGEIIEIAGEGTVWKPIGTLKSLGVKKSVDS